MPSQKGEPLQRLLTTFTKVSRLTLNDQLKCTGHRFGCQRCRDRNLVCTYTNASQPRRRKAGKVSTSLRLSSHGVVTPSTSEESMILPGTPAEDTKAPSPSQLPARPSAAKGCTASLQLPADRDFHATPPVAQAPASAATDSSHALVVSELPVTPPEFPDLTLPDYIESGLHDFEIQELLEADLALPDQNEGEFELDDAFTSSASPEEKAETRESSFANSIATSSGKCHPELTTKRSHKHHLSGLKGWSLVKEKRAKTSSR